MEKFRAELKNERQIEFENSSISGHTKIDVHKSTSGNAIAYRTVDDSDEWIVIGAHYDHLGWGGYGSGSRSPERHEIHYGADDNASGTALVLMLADYYATQNPNVNLAFILFAAEEQGLIGSKYFVENSPIAMEKIRAMLNFDMVGRVQENRISISGTSTAKEFEGILSHFQNKPLEIAMSGGGFAGSDQASFVSEDIPVLFFNSGLHEDYHTPEDNIEQINFEGIQQVGALSIALIDSLSHPDLSLTFQKQKQEEKVRHGGGMKVTLGIMPDVTGRVEKGLAVDGVRPGGPAEIAGIVKGDVIHKIDEFEIENIYDYMESLSKFKKGQQVELQIVRDEKPMTLKVEF
jgi:Zn-dependent M28 family amino/carboxypeptidase